MGDIYGYWEKLSPGKGWATKSVAKPIKTWLCRLLGCGKPTPNVYVSAQDAKLLLTEIYKLPASSINSYRARHIALLINNAVNPSDRDLRNPPTNLGGPNA